MSDTETTTNTPEEEPKSDTEATTNTPEEEPKSDTETTTNTPDQQAEPVKTKAKFPYKYATIAAGVVLVLAILWWQRSLVTLVLSSAAGLATIGFLLYAALAGFNLYVRKQPKTKWQVPFLKGLLGAIGCGVCYIAIGWVGNMIVPASYDKESLAEVRTAIYLMGLEDAVVTSGPDSAIVIAYGLESENTAVEALAKSGTIMGAAAGVISRGDIYTIGIVDNKPVVGIQGDLAVISKAIEDSSMAMELHSKLKVLDEKMLNKLWK